MPGYAFYTRMGLFAPAKTAPDVVLRIAQALRSAAATQTVRDRFKSDSIEAMDMAPRDVDQFLGQKVAGYAKIVTDLGLPQE